MLNKTLNDISAKLDSGEVCAVELCQQAISMVQDLNPVIGAFSDVLFETALNEAEASDLRYQQGRRKSALDGIPIAIKDIIDVTPGVCKAGLDVLSDYRPNKDAEVVTVLRNAGAVIIGVTETDNGAFGTRTLQTTNPLDDSLVVGGSSGGSAAAVAADMVLAAIGTDTGGSIRIPAGCCSIVGFKPTWGRITTEGVRPLAISLDHVGSMAKCVADLKIVQKVIDSAFHTADKAGIEDSLVLGIPYDYYADAHSTVHSSMARVVKILDQQHSVQAVSLPMPDQVLGFHAVTALSEAADYHLGQCSHLLSGYPKEVREAIELGQQYPVDVVIDAVQQRVEAKAMVDSIFDQVDAIILPLMPIYAPAKDMEEVEVGGRVMPVLEAMIRYTALFNQTGHPVVSIPSVKIDDERHFSIQIVGPSNSDAKLLDVSQQLENIFRSP